MPVDRLRGGEVKSNKCSENHDWVSRLPESWMVSQKNALQNHIFIHVFYHIYYSAIIDRYKNKLERLWKIINEKNV